MIKRKFAKLDGGYLEFPPNPILVDDCWIGNPPDSVYLNLGYKPVVFTDTPDPPDGYYYTETWTETEDSIVETWELVKYEPSPEEILNIILGGEDS